MCGRLSVYCCKVARVLGCSFQGGSRRYLVGLPDGYRKVPSQNSSREVPYHLIRGSKKKVSPFCHVCSGGCSQSCANSRTVICEGYHLLKLLDIDFSMLVMSSRFKLPQSPPDHRAIGRSFCQSQLLWRRYPDLTLRSFWQPKQTRLLGAFPEVALVRNLGDTLARLSDTRLAARRLACHAWQVFQLVIRGSCYGASVIRIRVAVLCWPGVEVWGHVCFERL